MSTVLSRVVTSNPTPYAIWFSVRDTVKNDYETWLRAKLSGFPYLRKPPLLIKAICHALVPDLARSLDGVCADVYCKAYLKGWQKGYATRSAEAENA